MSPIQASWLATRLLIKIKASSFNLYFSDNFWKKYLSLRF
ncbi:hypothetical protein vBEcoMWL3_gp241 [Escherichia phage vB_EcoM_WL-3]|nr:hypothetical protein vBEcoMWL3_gp241 [Escherichia phage vB_EcoM_WL-3]